MPFAVERNVNKHNDVALNHKCIKLTVIHTVILNNFIVTSCGYCNKLNSCKYPLKTLCDAKHLCLSSSPFQEISYHGKKWSLSVREYILCLAQTLNNVVGPTQNALVMLKVPLRSKVMHYKRR